MPSSPRSWTILLTPSLGVAGIIGLTWLAVASAVGSGHQAPSPTGPEGPPSPPSPPPPVPTTAEPTHPVPPTDGLPSYHSRAADAPTTPSWLPNAWYCRLPKEPDPLLHAKRDRAWEQRALDIYSWDAFIALMWPHAWDGEAWKPAETLLVDGAAWRPKWGTWWDTASIPSIDPSSNHVPSPFLRGPDDPWTCGSDCLFTHLAGENYDTDAGDNGIWDRNGNAVLFETRVNDAWLDGLSIVPSPTDPLRASFQTGQCATYYPLRICVDGECELCGASPRPPCQQPSRGVLLGDKFDFPSAIEVKLAWRILEPGQDDADRFVSSRNVVVDGRTVDLGLIAAHILQKPKTQPFWTWSTFEHVDNLEGHDGRPPSFEPGECPNTIPHGPVRRTHLSRLDAIHPATRALDEEVRGVLRGSPLAHYQLIGTQYTRYGSGDTSESTYGGTADCHLEAETAHADVFPHELRNVVLEPYLAKALPGCPNDIQPKYSSCIECHSTAPSCDFSFVQQRFGLPAPRKP